MKFISTQLSFVLNQPEFRENLPRLLKYLLLLTLVVITFGISFHFIMAYEGQDHSWFTGVYWALTVMSTLGFGDITFHTDLGRAFSLVVLLTGVVMLLIVLPFAFIRFFYAPWLEAQIKTKAPRRVPPGTSGHVIICEHGPIARYLIERLNLLHIPYFLVEEDVAKAAEYAGEGLSVVAGDVVSPAFWSELAVCEARGIVVNSDDARNANITLTVRHESATVPIIAGVDSRDSIDILELAGATRVLAIKERLGEALASRVNAGHAEAHVVGEFRGMLIAEFPVHNTPLVGKALRDTKFRESLGVNVVGIWEHGQLQPPAPDLVLTARSVPVVIGTQDQITAVNEFLVIYDTNYNPTIVLGGGVVGRAAAAALMRRGLTTHLVERSERLARRLSGAADRIITGDAADREVLVDAGLLEAPAVIISTNDDSVNAYLSIYCRRLNPEMRVVSRATHERNLGALHRAGSDFVLSYSSLGAESIISFLRDRDLMMLGAGVELFHLDVPAKLVGRTLAESGIGARTRLNVIAVISGGEMVLNPQARQVLAQGGELFMVGSAEQRIEFQRIFG